MSEAKRESPPQAPAPVEKLPFEKPTVTELDLDSSFDCGVAGAS